MRCRHETFEHGLALIEGSVARGFVIVSVLEFWNNLLGLGTEYICGRNRFLGIESWTPFKF
jgi:hypothetical protein